MTRSPMHIKALDGVRAISILLVLVTHTFPFGPSRWRLNEMSGLMGMSLFFCLSGFLIVTMLHRNADVLTFFVRRMLRIVPVVAIYIALMVLLFGIGWRAVIANALFYANYTSDGRGQGAAPMSHLWSLSVEVQFYAAIGLATLILGKRSLWLIPPMAIVVTLLRINAGATFNITTHLRVDEILAGGTLALLWLHWHGRVSIILSRPGVAWAVLGLAFGLWVMSCHPLGSAMLYLRPYTAASLVGILVFARFPLLHPLLEGRNAAYIARISYALYIYHPLMIWGWMNTGTDLERYLLKRPISYLMTLAAAHASTFYWEAPWQSFSRRLTLGKRQVVNA